MASSPRCPSCGYRALRFRKRTSDFRCARCKNIFPVGIADDELTNIEEKKRLTAVTLALWEIDAAACDIYQRHRPSMGPIPLLCLATLAIVFAMTLQSWPWYAALGSGTGASVVVFLILSIRHFNAWVREHPLLYQLLTTRITPGASVRDSQEALQACIEAVHGYLPQSESRELLGRLDEARNQPAGPMHSPQRRTN